MRTAPPQASFMVLDGVPESIAHEDYMALISALGLDPKNLRSLELRMDGVYAEVIARNDKGHMVVDERRNEVVVNHVYIPIKG